MLTVFELALWLVVYGFLCGAAETITGEKMHPLSFLIVLPMALGKMVVVAKGWDKKPEPEPDKGPTTLMENDGE